ncbi:hypothetical protein [Streptomyces cucumeris]|uniref:hypothetical protein n=1 Tax=Streptomyces cucumeris TaxID=2962890 RepID=UPI003D71CD1F
MGALVDACELAELRTMYVFTPTADGTWGFTFQALEDKLRERNPDEFIHVRPGGQVRGTWMGFGITFNDESLEGTARLSPDGVTVDGVSIQDCPAHTAADVASWLRQHLLTSGVSMTFNTEWGLEDGLPDAPVPDAPHAHLVSTFLAHLERTL